MKNFLKSTGLILLYLGTYFILQAIVAAALIFGYIFKVIFECAISNLPADTEKITYDAINFINNNSCLLIIISAIIAFLFYMLISAARKENIFRVCRFKKINISNIIAILFLGASTNVITILLIGLLPIEKLSPGYTEMMDSLNGNNLILTLLGVGIAAPFIEEVIFRGLIYNELRKHMHILTAAIIQGLLFGVYHLNIVQGIYAFALGLLLALIYNWTGTIWSVILLHSAFNTFNAVVSEFIDTSLLDKPVAALISLAVVLASFVIFALSMCFLWKNKPHFNKSINL